MSHEPLRQWLGQRGEGKLLLPLKTERTANKTYRSRDQAKTDVFDDIGRCYNPRRRHSTWGYLSLMEFERQAEFV